MSNKISSINIMPLTFHNMRGDMKLLTGEQLRLKCVVEGKAINRMTFKKFLKDSKLMPVHTLDQGTKLYDKDEAQKKLISRLPKKRTLGSKGMSLI